MKIFGSVGSVTSNSWLDFGDDSDHVVDRAIFKAIFTTEAIQRILLITPEVADEFVLNFWGVSLSH